ncbi:ATP-binding protein [Streptomyces sp. NPDC001070]
MSPHTTPSPHLLGAAPPPADRAHWLELPAERAGVRLVRHTMGERLASWRVPGEARADAVLILSELATNAVLHTLSTRILCGVELSVDGFLRLEVHDRDHRNRSLPPCTPSPEDESGRGLLLVRQIAHRWGVARSIRTGGNVVWALLRAAA